MIKAVIFDLDGTLLDRDTSIEQFISTQYDRLFDGSNHISKDNYTNRFIELDCHGHVWKDQVYQDLVAEFNIEEIGWQELLADYESQFQFHCIPFLFLNEMLDTLKQQGYLLGIITNGRGEFQNRAIDGIKIRDYFDVILISELEKVRKPQAEIFHRAIDQLEILAAESVFVGDNPEADIIGAKHAGMFAIWKRNAQWLEPQSADAIIDELNELPLIIDRFNHH
jgi:putative hydrolase of the HAD superfamily